MTKIDGLSFREAFATAVEVASTVPSFKIVSLEKLIQNKEATGRDKDKPDAIELRKLLKASRTTKS